MGEIADMMLDGTLCECCGTFIDEESYGIPRYCSKQCAEDRGVDFDEFEDEDNEDEYITPETICGDLDGGIVWIEIAIENIKKLKLKKKVRELTWIIRRLEAYKKTLMDS